MFRTGCFFYLYEFYFCRVLTNFGGEKKGPGKKKRKNLPADVLAKLPPAVPTTEVSSYDELVYLWKSFISQLL